MRRLLALIAAVGALVAVPARADDGYDLWLRYRPLPAAVQAEERRAIAGAIAYGNDARVASASGELATATSALLGSAQAGGPAALLGIAADLPADVRSRLPDLSALGDDGYLIRTVAVGGRRRIVVTGNTGAGVLYGTFALIRRMQLGQSLDALDLRAAPAVKLRVLDHWDNLDGSVERGYAGRSIWDWWRLPGRVDPRYTDYARANASIGINGAVLNNVNAKADSLTAPYIAKAAAIADVLRPWGMKVYLSARLSAPIELGGLKTADPRDPAVARWWRGKADEIWRAIPDFGGFLVKANSEGQPGPRDYGATHADGANMLAAAVRPHGGVVMWRAFVYAETDPEDRAKQAYSEFTPLDGRFAENVLVQVKNGPLDFQPREPFHPLFGAMPQTPLMLEVQITKEYLGFATHLAYLGTMWSEVLRARTLRQPGQRPGETVARVVDGSAEHHRLTGMAGVANIGSDRNWSGSTFDQANWYAFGRLAWDPDADPGDIARDWIGQTLSTDPRVVQTLGAAMLRSRQAVVDYMTPLGLAHLMGTGHHHGPAPWVGDLARPEWNPTYYHRADANGIGFDRTASGSDAVAQYAPLLARRLSDPHTTGDDLLLWFHHLPWTWRMADGATLWDTMVRRYDRGVATVGDFRRDWAALEPLIDRERWEEERDLLATQEAEARWWRDASIAYWTSLNHLPLPAGSAPPEHPLDWYRALRFPYAPGQAL